MALFITQQYWEHAHLYRTCAECQNACTDFPFTLCTECHRMYHSTCYANKGPYKRILDCECAVVVVVPIVADRQCLRVGCTRKVDCRETRYWTCRECFQTWQSELAQFILCTQKQHISLSMCIQTFRQSTQCQLTPYLANCTNPLFRVIEAFLVEIILAAPLLLVRGAGEYIEVIHLFTVCIREMQLSKEVYTLPITLEAFNNHRDYLSVDCPDFANQFKLYLREQSSKPNAHVRFIGARQVTYISDRHISTLDDTLAFIHKNGVLGVRRHAILAGYSNAIADLAALEASGAIYVSGDRSMVYDTKSFTPQIPGLLAQWSARPKPIHSLNTTCDNLTEPGLPEPKNTLNDFHTPARLHSVTR